MRLKTDYTLYINNGLNATKQYNRFAKAEDASVVLCAENQTEEHWRLPNVILYERDRSEAAFGL